MKNSVLVVLLLASAAWAFKVGDPLWVREADTPLFKEPDDAGKPIAVLGAGEKVLWLGPSEKNRAFHLVKARGRSGYVRFTALTPHGPEGSGDASADFSAKVTPPTWGTKSRVQPADDAQARAVRDLEAVEALNRDVATAGKR